MSKQKAIRLANTFVKNNGLTVPISVEQALEDLGVEVRYVLLEEHISGSVVFNADSTIVLVNQDHSKYRQRFTLAHELGHILLHKGTKPVMIDSKQVEWRRENANPEDFYQEVEANVFAANLLMPEESIYEYLEFHQIFWPDENDVPNMAKVFKVSKAAMRIRLLSLGIIDLPIP